MNRPFRTALLTVFLANAALGVAEAKANPGRAHLHGHTLAAAQIMAASAAVEAAEEPSTRADETVSNMPAAGADVAMWVPSAGSKSAAPSAMNGDAIHRFARGIVRRTSAIARSLTRDAMQYIGTPYVFGGTSPAGFDCSGYVQHVFAMLGIELPRTADAQYYAGRRTLGGITTGDLVFFQTYLPGPSHVGIYIGKDKFIHSSGHGVMISRLHDRYWSARYLGAKRVVALR